MSAHSSSSESESSSSNSSSEDEPPPRIMWESMAVQTEEDGTDLGDADLKGFFGRRTPKKRKAPPKADTGGSQKSGSNEGKEKDEKHAVGDSLHALANVGET